MRFRNVFLATLLSLAASVTELEAQNLPPTVNPVIASASTVTIGTSVLLVVSYVSSSPATFQWRLNGTPISGAPSAPSLTITSMQPTNVGSYDVVVTNAFGSATAASASIAISYSPVVSGVIRTPSSPTSVLAGSTVSFGVTVSGASPLSYQWRLNGTSINGATSANYSLASVTSADAGSYDVVVTNSYGSATSSSATLAISQAPPIPVVTRTPAPSIVAEGSTFTLTASISGTSPYTYQWSLNNAPINGATAAAYTVAKAQTTDAGNYTVAVSNAFGTTTSLPYAISLTYAPTIVLQPASTTGVVGKTGSVSFTVSASGTQPLSYQWYFNNAPIAGQTSQILSLFLTDLKQAGTYTVTVSNAAGSATSDPATLSLTAAPTITTQPLSQAGLLGGAITFTVEAQGSPPLTYQWTKDGNAISGATNATLKLTNLQTNDAGTYTATVTNSAASTKSINAVLTVSDKLESPSITAQPASKSAVPGTPVTFTVTATGTAPLNYQWYFNGSAVTGGSANSATFSITALAAFAGNYSVVVSNTAGSAQSATAVLDVASAPTITKQPTPQTVNPGGAATFTVTAAGSPAVSYLWFYYNDPVASGNTATLALANVTSARAGLYHVLVSNVIGGQPYFVESTAVMLTVNATPKSPEIQTNPIGRTVTEGTTVSFSVGAQNADANGFRYQWRRNSVPIADATDATLTISNVKLDAAGDYTVVVTNNIGSATSSAATLVVNPAATPAQISRQPADLAATAGGTATFTIAASGTAPLSYQWRKNGVAINGATDATLTLNAVQPSDAGSYSAVVTNSAGTVTSAAATLTVAPYDPGRLINLSILTTLAGDGDSFTVGTVAGGTGTSGTKSLLVRAAGPSLGQLGVTGTLADPKLELFSGQTAVDSNDDWGGSTSLSAAFAQVGAFAYSSPKDAAIVSSALPAGDYTVRISGGGNSTGTVIAELYDTTPVSAFAIATPRLINVSLLKRIAPGDTIVAGFAIGGSTSMKVLVRGVGPTLTAAPFNIVGATDDPKIVVYSGQTAVATNDNWSAPTSAIAATTAQLAAAFAQVGAFSLAADSKDTAVLATLPPGSYTAQVSVANSGGLVLVEIYEVP